MGSSSGRLSPRGKVRKDLIAESTGLLKISCPQGEAKPSGERPLVNGDLAPPGAIVIGKMGIRGRFPLPADEVHCWSGYRLAHDGGSFGREKQPGPRPS